MDDKFICVKVSKSHALCMAFLINNYGTFYKFVASNEMYQSIKEFYMNKSLRIIFTVLAVIMLFASCAQPLAQNDAQEQEEQQAQEPDTMDKVMLSIENAVPASPEDINDVQLGFNLALLKKLGETEEGNLFYSSMSINAAMTMVYFGADGETRQEIADVLGYGDMDITYVAAYQKYLLQSYEDSGDTTFNIANSIWIADFFDAKKSYMDTMEDVFETEVTRLDFAAGDAVDKLNSWIDKSTEGMIDKLFEKENNPFDATTIMVLLNAIYFEGDWTAPFDLEKTYEKDFRGATKTSTVKMMSSNETAMGNKGEDYISVLLPYGEDERFSMVAVVPDDMESFVESLTIDSLSEILNTFKQQHDPVVQIPAFEMEEKTELNNVLKALGIKQAFDSKTADFSQISDEEIFIDEVLHKAKIKVDEEGTEAAAVTSVEMTLRGMPMDRFEFIADKPFLFFIVDTENDLVLFTGKVLDLN